MAPPTATASGTNMPTANFESNNGPKSPHKAAQRSALATPCAENSTNNQRPVMGLRMATARKAAAAITDMGASSSGAHSGNAYCNVSPTTAPSVAPSATEGVSVPPAAPAPIEPVVIMAFKKSKITKKALDRSRCIATSARARPFPSKLGKSWERMPSAKKTVGIASRIFQSRRPSGCASCQATELYVSSFLRLSKLTLTLKMSFPTTMPSIRSPPLSKLSIRTYWPCTTSGHFTGRRACGFSVSANFTKRRKPIAATAEMGPMMAPQKMRPNVGHW
mmetsp:Transcript_6203/g.16575  ORF Transcript_6203/g.16575 Transcript_6203/m.16575 type:complete len:277 (-) Transcript_6203:748-1578(-)